MSSNPYAAPKAPVGDETLVLRGNFVAQGRGVPMGRGWDWIASGWNLFRAAAGTWIGMILVLAVISILCAVIPFVGPLASMVFWPVLIAGLMATARTIHQGGSPEFAQLFAGFKQRFGPLAGDGALYLVATVVIMLVVFFITGVGVFAMMGGAAPDARALGAMAIAMLVMLALTLPLVMAVWFAPALVMFDDLGPVEAMKASFLGCLKNVLPFLLYGIVLFIASIIASIPLLLGWLVLGPVLAASMYTSYRDIYFTE